jgi:hypothetical protein
VIGIELSDLLSPDALEFYSGSLPRLDPSFTESNLLRRPLSKGRRVFHAGILTFRPPSTHRVTQGKFPTAQTNPESYLHSQK